MSTYRALFIICLLLALVARCQVKLLNSLWMDNNIHTIVIGSGIAGMGVANTLANQGKEVLVIEANDYIGGRTKSVTVPLSNNLNFSFELGANWIHGSGTSNPITKLAANSNIALVETFDDNMTSFDMQGNDVNDLVDAQWDRYSELLTKGEKTTGQSLEQVFNEDDPESLANKYFLSQASHDIEFQAAAPLSQISAQYGRGDSKFNGKEMLVTNGYQAIAFSLSQNSNIKVLLNSKVTKVIHHEDGSNEVISSNGQSYFAPNIIIAVPLGVLKASGIEFSPALPNWKSEAINKIGFGNVCKVLVALKSKTINLTEHYIAVIDDDVSKRGLATYFLNLKSIAKLPALVTFGLGPNAVEIETKPVDQLKSLIAKRLQVLTEDDFTAEDIDIFRSTWHTQPNFKGAYSYSAVQTKPIHWQNMAKPIFDNSWHFCGEHTHSKYRATVHGAYISGLDAANAILKGLTEDNWEYQGDN